MCRSYRCPLRQPLHEYHRILLWTRLQSLLAVERSVTVPVEPTSSTLSPSYPAMTTHRDPASSTPQVATNPIASSATREQQAVATDKAQSEQSSAPASADSGEDVVIDGRKGSSAGTIAVPADQKPVPWPAVSGAPPGYPGKTSLVHACTFSSPVYV